MKRFGARRLFQFPWRTALDRQREIEEEFALHVDLRTDALVALGMTPEAARAQAMREFGNSEQARRAAMGSQQRIERRRIVGRWWGDWRQDFRLSCRSLLRTPGFTLTAVGIIALGIGATTALFSILSAVLLRPLPYPDSGRIVEVWDTPQQGVVSREAMALPDYRAYRDRTRAFDALGAFAGSSFIITGGERAEYVEATTLTATLWRVLGVQPEVGRVFGAAEEAWGRHRVAVISDRLWRRRFDGNPAVVGQDLRLGPQTFTVIGVMPPSFQISGQDVDLWVPMAFPPGSPMDSRRNRFASVVGRLKPGVTSQQAREDLSRIAVALAREEPQFNAGRGVDLEGWQEQVVGSVRSTLLLLFGAVVTVLLVACANLSNLLIARATVREQELHTRAMLGAGTGRLIRQVLAETVTLVLAGGAIGVGVAIGLLRVVRRVGPIGLPRLQEVTIDGTVLGFTAALMLLTTALFGVGPAWHAVRAAIGGFRIAARSTSGQRMSLRSRRLLIVAEVSLSLVLLIGATLLVVSLQRLQQVDAGFSPDRLYTARLLRFRPDGRDAFVQQVVEAAAALPGVRAAAATTSLPLAVGAWTKQFSTDDGPAPRSMADVPSVNYYHVTPDYFRAMGASLRRGRSFTAQDRASQPLVAIVNETLATRMWPGADPVGKRIAMFPPESLAPHLLPLPDGSARFPRLTIVGVVRDFRQAGLDQAPSPSVFVPVAQATAAGGGDQLQAYHYLVVRTTGDPLAVAATLETVVHQHDPNAALADVTTMESRLSDSIGRRRFAMVLLAGFAGLAVLLAVVGLYGVMSYTVSQRREELGLRAAVGASSRDLALLVVSDGLRMTLVGAGLGLLLAAGLSNVLSAQLFEVRGVNPGVYVAMTLMLLIVAAAACWIPALKASRVDPATALRPQ